MPAAISVTASLDSRSRHPPPRQRFPFALRCGGASVFLRIRVWCSVCRSKIGGAGTRPNTNAQRKRPASPDSRACAVTWLGRLVVLLLAPSVGLDRVVGLLEDQDAGRLQLALRGLAVRVLLGVLYWNLHGDLFGILLFRVLRLRVLLLCVFLLRILLFGIFLFGVLLLFGGLDLFLHLGEGHLHLLARLESAQVGLVAGDVRIGALQFLDLLLGVLLGIAHVVVGERQEGCSDLDVG